VNRRARHVSAALVKRAAGALLRLLDPVAWTRVVWLHTQHKRRKARWYAVLKQMRG
jgi:hypothetical protein